MPDHDKAYNILHVRPVDYSLTSGTDIPPPPDSPAEDITTAHNLRISRSPTPGGGPLSSHPTNSMPDAFPPTPEPEKDTASRPADTTMSSESNRDAADSFQTPTSPSSAQNTHDGLHDSPHARRPSGVRRLFSLSSLRQSFSSSRTSLSVNRPGSSYAVSSYGTYTNNDSTPRSAVAPSMISTTASTAQAPSLHSSKPSATLRKKRSSNWFKRKSGFFTMNEDGVLDVVSEDDGGRSGAKRFKESSHRLPMLPEISTLGGGELNEGSLGWDERAFRS
ncbi:hypothetical protein M409DRAFT_23956 [Zasmidium cellare ATCC 36951]|uniref:Uncharacterized protein n=1 Tax=Zasmidium cellare ATCC 36951 TaxID=1080233 RepID=A0A6A6CJR1_ZASCE|nr:uncharacterized protein M409DRAFT_23956 [Zasmidium cellare ATCC 36951]KAF2165666.1 hypothetical protein M409DRAFT_23956 [Zasmidium cellare ATCC 36951]